MTGNSTKITSDCEYHYQNMKYRNAMTTTNQTPCTNVPLNCPMCPQSDTFWKYGFISHIADRHLTESNELPNLDIPLDLWVATHISKWEEFRMGIPTIKTDEWRDANEFPDSDAIQLFVTRWFIPRKRVRIQVTVWGANTTMSMKRLIRDKHGNGQRQQFLLCLGRDHQQRELTMELRISFTTFILCITL